MRAPLMITALLLVTAIPSTLLAATPNYIGEYCWDASPGTATLHLGFTFLGDGYFQVNGRLDEVTPEVNTNLITGTAMVIGNELHIQYSSAGVYSEDNTGVLGVALLDLNNLNGYSEYVGMHVTRSSSSTDLSYDGTMTLTFVSCP